MPRELALIGWPFHNGLRDAGMGRGARLLAADSQFRSEIQAAGWTIAAEDVDAVDASEPEIARVVELLRRLAERARLATERGSFPFVLAGNCNSCLGTTAGVGSDGLGVVWFDAHADFDDPEENISGFFDVMGLAMLTGRGWRSLRQTIPGHRPVAENDVILAGVRDLEPYQRQRLDDSNLHTIPGPIDSGAFEEALDDLSQRVSRVYLHVDLDALDPSEGRANQYAAAGGPTLERLVGCLRATAERFTIAAAAITAYEPACDESGHVLRAARRIGGEVAGGARAGRGA